MMLEAMSALQHHLKAQSCLDLLVFYIEEEGLDPKSSKGVGDSIIVLFSMLFDIKINITPISYIQPHLPILDLIVWKSKKDKPFV